MQRCVLKNLYSSFQYILISSLLISPMLNAANAESSASLSPAEIKEVRKVTHTEQPLAASYLVLAALAETKGQWKKARAYYEKILDIYKNDPGIGTNSARYAYILSKAASCDKRLGEKDLANKKCQDALAIVNSKNFSDNIKEHNYDLMTRDTCAAVIGKAPAKKQEPKSLPELTTIAASDIKDLAEREKQVKLYMANEKNKNSAEQMNRRIYLANVYTLEKKFDLAEAQFKQILRDIESKEGKHSPRLLTPLSNYGFMLKQQGKQKESDLCLERMQALIGVRQEQKPKSIVLHIKKKPAVKNDKASQGAKKNLDAKSQSPTLPKTPAASPAKATTGGSSGH